MKSRGFISILVVLFFFFSHANAEKSGRAVQWGRWEHSLMSSAAVKQPADLDIVFTGPAGKTIRSHAFTDDNMTFTFRASFPEPGTWKWKTTFSDPSNTSLNNKKGSIKVEKYEGDNPLYKHGYLKISTDRRYLVHADGTPFLWMGETGWNATLKGTMAEWRDYVDTRIRQGFSVIQISPRGSGNKNIAAAGQTISVTKEGTPDPVWWKDLEDKIAYANDNGVFILMVGIGSAWRDMVAQNPSNQKFEKYITGRLTSHMVIYSPSFDQLFIEELDNVARELKKNTWQLVTQHPGTNYEANIKYRNTSVDFGGEQSGHHGGNLTKVYNAARQWTLDMWNGSPVKPVIDIEAMYDGYGHNDAKNWREKDARKCGWIAWMSGSRGYTYGCGDIPPKVPAGNGAMWLFNKDSSTYDFWRKAINWRSASQMTVMRDFFRSVEWWKLVPAHELVMNQEEDEMLKMVASKTSDLTLILAYLPDNPKVFLNLTDFPGKLTCTWMNPQTGEKAKAENITGGNGKQEFSRPSGWEDALLILVK